MAAVVGDALGAVVGAVVAVPLGAVVFGAVVGVAVPPELQADAMSRAPTAKVASRSVRDM
jgi:hypothetical protein